MISASRIDGSETEAQGRDSAFWSISTDLTEVARSGDNAAALERAFASIRAAVLAPGHQKLLPRQRARLVELLGEVHRTLCTSPNCGLSQVDVTLALNSAGTLILAWAGLWPPAKLHDALAYAEVYELELRQVALIRSLIQRRAMMGRLSLTKSIEEGERIQ